MGEGRDVVMDYPCAKFGDCTFSRFDFIMQTQNRTHTQHTDVADCYTHATTIGISNYTERKDITLLFKGRRAAVAEIFADFEAQTAQ